MSCFKSECFCNWRFYSVLRGISGFRFLISPDRLLSPVQTLKCYFQRFNDMRQDSVNLSHLRNILVQSCMIHQINYLVLFELWKCCFQKTKQMRQVEQLIYFITGWLRGDIGYMSSWIKDSIQLVFRCKSGSLYLKALVRTKNAGWMRLGLGWV